MDARNRIAQILKRKSNFYYTTFFMYIQWTLSFHPSYLAFQYFAEFTNAFSIVAVFYTDDDIHFEWDQLAVLDKSIAHFELISYEKSKTIQEFISGINTRQRLFLVHQRMFC